MKRVTLLFCCVLLCACAVVPSETSVLTIEKQETYFEYDAAELDGLPVPQEGAEQPTVSQLLGWDVRLMDVTRKLLLPPTTASRLYANVAIAQNDAIALGADMRGVHAVGSQVACVTVPASCALFPELQPSEYGLEVATLVTQKMIERNLKNDAVKKMPKEPEPGPNVWTDMSATTPDAGSWLPFAADSVVEFPAPIAYGSPEDQLEVLAVEDAVRTTTEWQRERIEQWSAGISTETLAGLWLVIAGEEILEQGITSAKDIARLRATLTTAMADSFINVWRTKITYWTARPSKRDTEIGTLIILPLYPSYPSEHATVSAAAATILSTAFPEKKEELWRHAREASDSRIWAGLHFPHDSEKGLEMGEVIGEKVLSDPRFAL